MSYVLRHRPDVLDLTLDAQGWTAVSELLTGLNRSFSMDMKDLEYVVQNNDKKRFEFNEDRTKIRASQGHSIQVELGYSPKKPPQYLFHGTHRRNVESILKNGINKGSRHHVHLSPDRETAKIVALRRGRDFVLLKILAEKMSQTKDFYESTNGVWLTDHIPPEFIEQ